MESMEIDTSFWKGKKVLLTGHTGFKGSWLSLWLQKMDSDLIGFSKGIPSNPSLFEAANVENGMTSITGNVCDYKELEKSVREHKPEIVIHMAAQSLVRESYKDPLETYSTNVMGTVNVLETVRKVDCIKAVLVVTSDKCYKNTGKNALTEEDPIGGFDTYSSSKGCAELVTSSYRNSFFNPARFNKHGIAIASARAGNVIGGGDWGTDRLLPDIIRGMIDNTKIKIRNPNAIRPWQYVLDPLRGYLMLIEKLWKDGANFSDAWNFGPEASHEKTVGWIVKYINKNWNNNIDWETDHTDNPHEETYLLLDSTKARAKLDWRVKTGLEDAILATTKWYQEFMNKSNMREYTEKQIDEFVSI